MQYCAQDAALDESTIRRHSNPTLSPTLPGFSDLPLTEIRQVSPVVDGVVRGTEIHNPCIPDIQKDCCTCLACAGIGMHTDDFYSEHYPLPCRSSNCQEQLRNYWLEGRSFQAHEKTHYRVPGAYLCREESCSVKAKTWADLRRHTKSVHCKKPRRFPCHFPWCKRSGDNGFPRKDKLTDHIRNVHEGRVMPGRADRVIKPAAKKDNGLGYRA